MKRLIIFLLLFAALKVAGQSIGHLRFDTVMIYKVGGTGELALINSTKDTLGVLVNYENGRTRFMKSRAINDSTIVVGLDTLVIRGVGIGTGSGANNTNEGTGFTWLNEGTQVIKRVADSWGIKWDSTSTANTLTAKPDTGASGLATQFDLSQKLDSIHVYTDASDPDTIYAYKNGDSTLVGYIPKGGGSGSTLTTIVRPPQIVHLGDSAMGIPDTLTVLYDTTTITIRTTGPNDSALTVNTANISTVQRLIDSLAEIRADFPAGDNWGTQVVEHDITMTGDGTSGDPLKGDTSVLATKASRDNLADSLGAVKLNVSDLPPIIPGVYIAPAQSFNPGFLVIGFAIVRPTSAWSSGATIPWELLTSGDHQPSFFDSAYGHASNSRLVVRFPTVKNVLSVNINPDEQLAAASITVGPTVALDDFEAVVTRDFPLGVTLRGAGTNTWTKVSGTSIGARFDVTTYNTADGGTSLNMTSDAYGFDYNGINVQYIGQNNYHIKRAYTGLGAYNMRFLLRDEFDNPVSANPASTDEIVISNAGKYASNVNMRTFGTTNTFLTTSANFWVIGTFEAWIVAAPISTSTIQVRFQTVYPSATNYKIYRSTSLYGAETLIHTGTDGLFVDTGLSASTVYYYKMYATIGGVDTYITYFRTNTYF